MNNEEGKQVEAASTLNDRLGGIEPYVACGISRDSKGAPCECGGYADRQDESPTKEEIKKYDCGRRYACCTAVFICRVCGKRFIGKLNAPECNW